MNHSYSVDDRHAALNMLDLKAIEEYLFGFDLDAFLAEMDVTFDFNYHTKVGGDDSLSAFAYLGLINGQAVDPYMVTLLALCRPAPAIDTTNLDALNFPVEPHFISSLEQAVQYLDSCRDVVRCNYSFHAHVRYLTECHEFFSSTHLGNLYWYAYGHDRRALWNLTVDDLRGERPPALTIREDPCYLPLCPKQELVHKTMQKQYADTFACLGKLGLRLVPLALKGMAGFLLTAHRVLHNGTEQSLICGFAVENPVKHTMLCHILYQHPTRQGGCTHGPIRDQWLIRTAGEVSNLLAAYSQGRMLMERFTGDFGKTGLESARKRTEPHWAVNLDAMTATYLYDMGFEACTRGIGAGHSPWCRPQLRITMRCQNQWIVARWEPPCRGVFVTRVSLPTEVQDQWTVSSGGTIATMNHASFVAWVEEHVETWHTEWIEHHRDHKTAAPGSWSTRRP